MRTVVASLAFAAALSAQDLVVDVRLAADQAATGPDAWVWLRETCVPEWARGAEIDPWGPLRIRLEHGEISVSTSAPPDGGYSTGEIRWRDRRLASIAGNANGGEIWEVPSDADVPTRARTLVELLGLDAPEAQTFDLAAVAAHLSPALPHDDGLTTSLLTIGAARCGNVRFVVEPRSAGWTIHGHSGGGLLLAAAIVMVAELQTEPVGRIDEGREVVEADHWRLLAWCSRHGARTEAAAQLARIGDADAIEALESLLWSRDERSAAMAGLIRAGSKRSLDVLRRTATEDPLEARLLDAAVVNFAQRPERRIENAASSGVRPALLMLLAASFVFTLRRYLRLRHRPAG
ncbi:MAG: HEAT repeat domain-containing protein [Planctomycetes bacterium]|nr:HEAT repeat domain-containing protein [Planctomycetota bacterium]